MQIEQFKSLIDPLRQDLAEIKNIVKEDHDVLILTKAQSDENCRDINRLFEKQRDTDKIMEKEFKKVDGKIWRIALAFATLGGGGFGITKLVGL